MSKKEEKCIFEEISIENPIKVKVNDTEIRKKLNKVNDKKMVNSNLNLGISITVFIIMSIVALVLVLNKGHFGEYSLVYVNDALHTAELECDTYFLSTIDNESTGVSLTIDGATITEGFKLNSSDEEIAKIENNRIVVGEKEGVATITAYYEEYDMTITTEVVAYIPINTITATVGNSTLKPGQETTLKVKIIPTNGTDEYITFKSSDETIATVNSEGIITGVSKGTVTITIEDELTGASGAKKITVK